MRILASRIIKSFNLALTNKRFFSVFIFLALLGLFLPLYPAQAFFEEIAKGFFNSIILAFLSIPLAISGAFLSLANWVLQWVISPSFTKVSFTGSDNLFVSQGWRLTRDLANMGFIVALVFIGLGTALRIGDYEAKKALPRLIGIALLINFTPLIAGFFIDASNIAMNFFLEGVSKNFGAFVNTLLGQTGSAINQLGSADPFSFIAYVLAMVIFNWVAALILILFASLFAARYIALWILVILSPFAFFAFILPATKGWWKDWWNQFFKWCFCGVIAAFWLYLAAQLIAIQGGSGSSLSGAVPPPSSQGLGGITGIMGYVLPLILLYFGYTSAQSTGGTGASQVINWTQKGRKAAQGWALQRTAEKTRELVPERVKRAGERFAMSPTWGTGEKGLAGALKRGAAAPVWAIGRKVGETVAGIPQIEKQDASGAEKTAMGKDVKQNLAALRSATSRAQRAGIISAMISRSQTEDAIKADKVGTTNVLREAEMQDAYKTSIKIQDKDMRQRMERGLVDTFGKEFEQINSKTIDAVTDDKLAQKMIGEGELTEGGLELMRELAQSGAISKAGLEKARIEYGQENYRDTIMAGAKDADKMKELQKDWWKGPELMEAAHKFWGGNQVGEASRRWGKEFQDKFQAFADEKGIEWYTEKDKNTGNMRNAAIPLYLSSTTAQGLGYTAPGGMEQDKVKKAIKDARDKITSEEKFPERFMKRLIEEEMAPRPTSPYSGVMERIIEEGGSPIKEERILPTPKEAKPQMKSADEEIRELIKEKGLNWKEEGEQRRKKAVQGRKEEKERLRRWSQLTPWERQKRKEKKEAQEKKEKEARETPEEKRERAGQENWRRKTGRAQEPTEGPLPPSPQRSSIPPSSTPARGRKETREIPEEKREEGMKEQWEAEQRRGGAPPPPK